MEYHKDNMNKKVAIVILNYKNPSDTIECVKSIQCSSYKDYNIFIVDNNSMDGSFEQLTKTYPQYQVYETGNNGGYAAGNNFAIKIALKQNYDYVAIVNNDVIVEKDTLKKLVDYLNQNCQVGIVGPKICNYPDTEIIQSMGFRVILAKGRTPAINEGKKASSVHSIVNCDALCGAFMLIRREVLQRVGLMPELYFLFFEETDWCLHVKNAGFLIQSIPNAVVYHKGSASIDKVKGLKLYYMSRNSVLFVRRNGSWSDYLVFLCYSFFRYFYCLFMKKQNYNEILNAKAFMKGMFMRKTLKINK